MVAGQERVAAAVRREVASLILNEMRDPRLARVTVTNATISRDLTVAKVYVSVLGEKDALLDAVEALKDAAGFIRHKISPHLSVRAVPELVFVPDDSAARAQRLEKLFKEQEAEFGEAPPVVDDEEPDDDEGDFEEEDWDDEELDEDADDEEDEA
jgi:ribosome-binding factor A